MFSELEAEILSTVRSGGLVRFKVELEQGEFDVRQLWLRPKIKQLIDSGNLDSRQAAVVNAALRRFITGGPLNVVTKDCPHREVAAVGDIRELKGPPPPFLELRFKPPRYDLRFFGRCIGQDRLILTSYGMKSLTERTGHSSLKVSEHRARCEEFFRQRGFEHKHVPEEIRISFSNAEFV
jgi:hypothetical protein